MDTPKGLLVPVLRRAQSKSILDIAHELTELQRWAASGGFTEDHLSGATIRYRAVMAALSLEPDACLTVR
eukprot:48385-Eustigmatos_ZCMA.PRE.1